MHTQDFLLELGAEELPPKLLQQLSNALTKNLTAQLSELKLSFAKVQSFATPRRLAVLVKDLQCQQNDQKIERKGPAISAPSQAVEGFAKSCGVSKEALEVRDLSGTDYYFFNTQQKGLSTKDLLQEVVDTAIKKIPITRAMRWGDLDFSFVRPTHWLVMMLDDEVVDATIMGLKSGNTTQGMRFTGERKFTIDKAGDYQQALMDKAQIEVDFTVRRESIRQQVMQVASENNATAIIDESLLNEVCALVEYPKAFSGKFDKKFLAVPEEALISAMKSHQKYFHMVDANGALLPAFISVANIESSDLSVIIDGNERVIHPRLSDSEFFWEQDKANSLESRLEKLDSVLFMKSLGSMGDKAKRIESLAAYIAKVIGADTTHSARAGLLAKTDLVTDMVGEFADLQGVMGGYYAQNDGEDISVSKAIAEHYHPRFSGDSLPSTKEGLAVAIADKIDSIVGIYGIGHKPTGSKDPYALKRAGLGLLRMIIESKLRLDLFDLISQSANLYNFETDIRDEINNFISSRLGAYYQEQGIDKIVVKAAQNTPASASNHVYDLHLRIQALYSFMQDENSKDLIESNKRINNILKDNRTPDYTYSLSQGFAIEGNSVNFSTEFEKSLANALTRVQKMTDTQKKDYLLIVQELLKLKPVIDDFFDNVMVIDDNLEIRNGRLVLIDAIKWLFISIADFSYLSK
ncbi:Glycyl-tRNA synthetase beta chain [uncultured Candidatus Thioglobus sp.]|nr:Glycyl-tRNA synthetase beta chain [uncultured Candidatus Thioglobus sp.]